MIGASDDDPLWYKDAIIYELHVRAFLDSTADGTGDFHGLTSRLDYLQDLGATALWLLPFYPSPLKDDGYDIADYRNVHPAYGTLHDFKVFLRDAHRRGLRVITELVLNHTSDQCSWFQKSRRAKPGAPLRDFYVWSETQDRYRDARILFKDFEPSNWTWDPVAKAYYWHRFYSHQPDLNFENPAVRKAMIQLVDFWLGMGVDGLRPDAVPYLFEREGTPCENIPETHEFLKQLREHVDGKFKGRLLLAEANQWPEDAVPYFGAGDACHMAFHFPLMPRLFMAIRMEDRFPILDILEQTPAIPPACQWATFLRNHDELTLEMVTDEERDYMYRVYAHDRRARINFGIRRRLAPLLENNRRKIELMNGLLFSLIGTPVIYYGDEIGMGDNIYLGDRNGVRTPMQWTGDRNAGFSKANAQQLYLPVIIDSEYHYETVNVEAQQKNVNSLLWWMKRLISLRKSFRAFGRGSLEFLLPENRKVLAFLRRHEGERILVVANLSRFVQSVELDLSAFRGAVPVELFGRIALPPVGERPYFLTLGPHAFYWLSLEAQHAAPVAGAGAGSAASLPRVAASSLSAALRGSSGNGLDEALVSYLKGRRWCLETGRRTASIEIEEALPVENPSSEALIALVKVAHIDGDHETYAVPIASRAGGEIGPDEPCRQGLISRLGRSGGEDGLAYDGTLERGFCTALIASFARRRRLRGSRGDLVGFFTQECREALSGRNSPLEPAVVKGDQRNTSIVYGGRFLLKLFRRVEAGVHPEVEVGRFLLSRRFAHAPRFGGYLEYRPHDGEPMVLGVLHHYVPNECDGWRYTLDALGRFFDRAITQGAGVPAFTEGKSLLDLPSELTPAADELLGAYTSAARLLGQRAAELHGTLASDAEDPDFAPEPYTPFVQRSFYQSLRNLVNRVLQTVSRQVRALSGAPVEKAQEILDSRAALFDRFRPVSTRKLVSKRIRCHGDLHLGEVLYTGKDFVLTDFEGVVGRTLGERRLKSSPLRDVASMLRSMDRAAHAALLSQRIRPEDRASLEPWARFWRRGVSAIFLKGYLETVGAAPFFPQARDELELLLEAHLLELALQELGQDLTSRPEQAKVSLEGILQLLKRAF